MIKKLLILLICLSTNAFFVNAQDTTHVRSHNGTHLNWYGDFVTKTRFPAADTSYKKILLKFTIGCPTNGCSDWDYTVKVYARRPIGVDTGGKTIYEYIEFARYITPYSGDKNFGFYRDFEADITDFRSVLTDSTEIGVKYEGYSDGFTVSLDYYFVKGTPIREAYKVVPVYYGGFPYGDPNNSIENYLKPFKFKTNDSTDEVGIHILQTGHGFGGNEDCAEFCPKYNYIKIDGTQRYSNLIWKDDCGENPLFAQPGTWLYDRANWCPGEMVRPFYHNLTPFLNSDSTTFDLNMTPFTNVGNNSCSYNVAANLIYYKNRVANIDLSLEEVLAPSKKWANARFNPICGQPKIKVKNNGSLAVNGLKIEYGFWGTSNTYEYIWNGTIDPYKSQEIDLPAITFAAGNVFYSKIYPADSTWLDYDMFNNTYKTDYNLVKGLPQRFGIEFRSNSAPDENSYEIQDANGNIIFSRDGFKANTMHKDTVNLTSGCYTFIVYDSDKDGMNFFANSDGVGSVRFRDMGNVIFQSFNANFGTEIRFHFVVDTNLTGLNTIEKESFFKVYPNPASDKCFIENNSNETILSVKLFNLQGQLWREYDELAGKDLIELDLTGIGNSYYFFEIETTSGVYREKVMVNNEK
jgi:hypothetical protein